MKPTQYASWKAVMDRIVAVVLISLLLPFIALISIAIRMDSPGSPVFTQARVGKNGRHFTIYKFRTMHLDNDESSYREYVRQLIQNGTPYKVDTNGQSVYKLVNDPRVTTVGAFLRKTNLDELPQVFNVLKGDMSFVGPRPDIPFAVELYDESHMA